MTTKFYKLNIHASDTIETRISISGDTPVSYCNARYSDSNGNSTKIDRYGSPTYAHYTQQNNKFMIKVRNFNTDWTNPFLSLHLWKNADYGNPVINESWQPAGNDFTFYIDFNPPETQPIYLERLTQLSNNTSHITKNSLQ